MHYITIQGKKDGVIINQRKIRVSPEVYQRIKQGLEVPRHFLQRLRAGHHLRGGLDPKDSQIDVVHVPEWDNEGTDLWKKPDESGCNNCKSEKIGWLKLKTGSVQHYYLELEGGGRVAACGREDDPRKLEVEKEAPRCTRCVDALEEEK